MDWASWLVSFARKSVFQSADLFGVVTRLQISSLRLSAFFLHLGFFPLGVQVILGGKKVQPVQGEEVAGGSGKRRPGTTTRNATPATFTAVLYVGGVKP